MYDLWYGRGCDVLRCKPDHEQFWSFCSMKWLDVLTWRPLSTLSSLCLESASNWKRPLVETSCHLIDSIWMDTYSMYVYYINIVGAQCHVVALSTGANLWANYIESLCKQDAATTAAWWQSTLSLRNNIALLQGESMFWLWRSSAAVELKSEWHPLSQSLFNFTADEAFKSWNRVCSHNTHHLLHLVLAVSMGWSIAYICTVTLIRTYVRMYVRTYLLCISTAYASSVLH